jgi:hypothetical protein
MMILELNNSPELHELWIVSSHCNASRWSNRLARIAKNVRCSGNYLCEWQQRDNTILGQLLGISGSGSGFEIRYGPGCPDMLDTEPPPSIWDRVHVRGFCHYPFRNRSALAAASNVRAWKVAARRRSGGWFGTGLLCRSGIVAHILATLLEQRLSEDCADGVRYCFEVHWRAHFIAEEA